MKSGIVFPGAEGRQRHVGQVRTELKLTNTYDEGRALNEDILLEEVRSVLVHDALVDTGANLLALPSAFVEQLGLTIQREVTVETAAGVRTARIVGPVTLEVEGRRGTFECLELPGGDTPLLGEVPLEALGLELDLQNQRLIVVPDRGPGTYVMAL